MKNSIKNLSDKAIQKLNAIKGGNSNGESEVEYVTIDGIIRRRTKGGFVVDIDGI